MLYGEPGKEGVQKISFHVRADVLFKAPNYKYIWIEMKIIQTCDSVSSFNLTYRLKMYRHNKKNIEKENTVYSITSEILSNDFFPKSPDNRI